MTNELFDLAPELAEVNLTNQLPYTKLSVKNWKKVNPMIGSVANLSINQQDAQMMPQKIFKNPGYSIRMPMIKIKEFETKLLKKLSPSTASNNSNVKAMMKPKVPKNSEQIVEQTRTSSQASEITAKLNKIKKLKSKNDDEKSLKEVTAQFSNKINQSKSAPIPIIGTRKLKNLIISDDFFFGVKNHKKTKSANKKKKTKIKEFPRHSPNLKEKIEIEKNPNVVVQKKKKENSETQKKKIKKRFKKIKRKS